MNLPIDLLLPEILASLEKNPNLIIEASPGSGKTTRVPPALLKSTFCGNDQEILVLEPRRLAAKYSAHRIATSMGSRVGELVGYQFRFENVSSPKTRLRFLTEGTFIRLLMRNSKLHRVAAVVLDEFHERHIHSDVALSYVKWLQKTHRPDLRIVLMSATLESESLSRYLGGAPILRLNAELHPVALHYLPSPPAKHLDQMVRETVLKALHDTSGDILVFLPGRAEMVRCERSLAGLSHARVCLLHGDLTRDEQDQSLSSGGLRKVILSTNIAETSLTIPGVTAVIDGGLHRRASYSWWSGIPSLKTRPICRASAIQRAGRAGRTGPGICYRLFTKGDFDTRPGFETAEVTRSDISQILLDLKAMGVVISDFPWFESPPPQALKSAEDLLFRLGATEGGGHLTEVGQRMAKIPIHPRISRILLEAKRLNVLEPATWLAAALSEGRIESGNILDSLVNYSKDDSLRKMQRNLLQSLTESNPPAVSTKVCSESLQILARSVLMGFPDRVAQTRKLGTSVARGSVHEIELLLSQGGSAILAESQDMKNAEFFVLLDLQEQQNQTQKKSSLHVRSWVPISVDWLLDVKPCGVGESEKCTWDIERQKVVVLSRLTYGELVLSESFGRPSHPKEALSLLVKNVLGIDPESAQTADWVLALSQLCESSEAQEIESSFARANLYYRYLNSKPQDFWPKILPHLEGKSSRAELKNMDWPSHILEALLGENAHVVRDLLPIHVLLPSGRRTKIHYSLSQDPWIQSRLQDFFGMKKGPVILDGRLPLLIHLLAPNQRPVQVTSDLESFWKNHYPQLRLALSRRYPRHSWPENPYSLLIKIN